MDLIAASAAKVKSIGVLSGYGLRERLEEFTNVIFCDTYEAVVWLKSRDLSQS